MRKLKVLIHTLEIITIQYQTTLLFKFILSIESKTIIELLLSYPSTTIDLVRLFALTKSSRLRAKKDSFD